MTLVRYLVAESRTKLGKNPAGNGSNIGKYSGALKVFGAIWPGSIFIGVKVRKNGPGFNFLDFDFVYGFFGPFGRREWFFCLEGARYIYTAVLLGSPHQTTKPGTFNRGQPRPLCAMYWPLLRQPDCAWLARGRAPASGRGTAGFRFPVARGASFARLPERKGLGVTASSWKLALKGIRKRPDKSL